MLSHVTLGTADWPKARPFWISIMEVLGHPILFERVTGIAFGLPTGIKTAVGPAFDGDPSSPGSGVHMAYLAKDRATVDAFYSAALARGGSDEGPPSLRPHYHAHYYGAYVRDPDGNKLQAVCHSRAG